MKHRLFSLQEKRKDDEVAFEARIIKTKKIL
jgi:hypothetical protein